jgi:hypothetical protein
MNFDPPHLTGQQFSDGLDMKVSTRQKQGATRHKGVGAKGDNSAFPAPAWPSNPGYQRSSPTRSVASGYPWLAALEGRRGASASMRTLHWVVLFGVHHQQHAENDH